METTRTTPRAKHCSDHCAKCNYCFGSTKAFDAHIEHEGELNIHNPPVGVVYSTGPREGQVKLESTPGLCDHQPGCYEDGRLIKRIPGDIWTVSLTQVEKDRLQKLTGRSGVEAGVS